MDMETMSLADESAGLEDMRPDRMASLLKTLKARREEVNAEKIEAVGIKLAKLRTDAVTHRKQSGIEDIWLKCEEAYLGIDDANRAEFSGQTWAKPMTMDAPLSRTADADSDASTVFVKITSRYVDASAARLADILMPVDDKPFSVTATPLSDEQPGAIAAPAVPAPLPMGMPQDPNAPPQTVMAPIPSAVNSVFAKSEASAKKAETRIWDWLIECNYPAEMRKIIHDAARIGVGVVKGPIPKVRTLKKAVKVEGSNAMKLTFVQEVKPSSEWADPWNIYPDPACGENVRDGEYLWEHDTFSTKQLSGLKGQPADMGYLDSQVDKVLKEGPGKRNALGAKSFSSSEASEKFEFDVWHFYGKVARADMETVDAAGIATADKDKVSVIVTMVNDSVIRAALNPMESEEIPFGTMSWKRRAGNWAGVGVGEDLFASQAMVNGATRAMLDGAGLSAGGQFVVDRNGIRPADGNWKITRNKIWYKTDESLINDVRQAFNIFTVPSVQTELMNIIQFAMRTAEEAAGLPLIAQGQSGENPTYGQDQLQNNNANTLLRRVSKAFDDGITVPQIDGFHEWLMMDPSVPDDEKQDFVVNIHGSAALVERSIQDKSLMDMGGMIANPAFGIDPKKWFAEMCRSKFMDPTRIQYSEEEMAKRDSQPPSPPPQIAVAQIRAKADAEKAQFLAQQDQQKTQATLQHEEKIAQLENQTAQTRIKVDTDRDTALVTSQHEKNMADAQARMAELQVKLQLAQLDYASKHQITIEQLKTRLAETTMKLQVTKELSAASNAIDVHKHHNPSPVMNPPIEPNGRAENGQSYAQ